MVTVTEGQTLHYVVWNDLEPTLKAYLNSIYYKFVLHGVFYGDDAVEVARLLVVQFMSNGDTLVQVCPEGHFSPVKLPEQLELAIRPLVFDEILPNHGVLAVTQTLFWNIITGDVLEWY